MTPASGRCSILKVQALLADALRDLQVRLASVLKKLGQVLSDWGMLIEQQLLEHRLVDRNHLPQIRAGKVHGLARIFAGSICTRYATASYSEGASQKPSVRNMTAGSVLTEIAFSGGVSSLMSST